MDKRTPTRLLKSGLNSVGSHHCASLVSAGDIDKDSAWSFGADDGDKLLGSDGKNWANYAQWFLGEDTTAADQTKARYKYPFGKDGKVFRSALIAIRSRAAQQNDDPVFNAAGHFIDEIDGKKNYSGRKALPMLMRSWSKLELKSVDDATRTLTGMASTPSSDRMNDVVEPMGAEYDLPLPFLWQHDSDTPIGHVTSAKPGKNGIPVTIQLVQTDEPGMLKDMLDYAWQSIKLKLVQGLSIGFAPIEYAFMDDGGIHFTKWAWLELSGVTIPANADCSITSIKSLDLVALKAMQKRQKIAKEHVVVKLSRDLLIEPKKLKMDPFSQAERIHQDSLKSMVVEDYIGVGE